MQHCTCFPALTHIFLQGTTPPYPLASKLAVFKKFRKSLAEFLHRLVAAASDLGMLTDDQFIPTIQSWVFAMSSSQLRSFRHTAAVVALEVETALCDVAAAAEKEAETLVRQRDAEKKKKGRSAAREKELETKSKQANAKRTKLKEFLKEFFEGYAGCRILVTSGTDERVVSSCIVSETTTRRSAQSACMRSAHGSRSSPHTSWRANTCVTLVGYSLTP